MLDQSCVKRHREGDSPSPGAMTVLRIAISSSKPEGDATEVTIEAAHVPTPLRRGDAGTGDEADTDARTGDDGSNGSFELVEPENAGLVWVTPKGDAYHFKYACEGLSLAKRPPRQVPFEQAQEDSYCPCKLCATIDASLKQEENEDVFTALSGRRYHRDPNCRGLTLHRTPINEAIADHKTPCRFCGS